ACMPPGATEVERMQLAKIVALLVVAGCSTPELKPAGTANQGGPAAVQEHAGVRVYADPSAWRGSLVVQRELVPVELGIENAGAEPLHFSRADVALVGPGHRLLSVAPEQIALEAEPVSLGLDPRTPEYFQVQGGQSYHPPRADQPTVEARAAAIK